MKKIMEQRKQIIRVYLSYILPVFVVILLFNFLTPYVADDWYYASSDSFLDIFRQEYKHYFTTNGRSVAHIIARFFLIHNKVIFNIANSVIYILFSKLIFVHVSYGLNLGKKEKLVCWIMIQFLLFIYVVNWGQVFLWLDGACNYLWTGTIILLYLLPFRIYYSTPERLRVKYVHMFPLMCFGGFLAGWCNENTSGGAILFSIILVGIFTIKKVKLQRWMFGGIFCSLISFTFMILSPGNAQRKTYFLDDRAWYNQLISHFQLITNNIFNNYKYLFFVIAIVTVVTLVFHMSRKYLVLSGVYLLTSIAIFYALILSPANNGRAFFGGSVFLIITCVSLFSEIMVQRTESLGGGNRIFSSFRCCFRSKFYKCRY